MQLRHFVSGSSVILIGWLAVTFVHQVPSQAYPRLDRYPTTSIAKPKTASAAVTGKPADFTVSVSR